MFWFIEKTLSGSQRRLSATSRSYLSAPNVDRTRVSSMSLTKLSAIPAIVQGRSASCVARAQAMLRRVVEIGPDGVAVELPLGRCGRTARSRPRRRRRSHLRPGRDDQALVGDAACEAQAMSASSASSGASGSSSDRQ